MAIKLDQVNILAIDEFTSEFKDVAEHSPWVAEAAVKMRPYVDKLQMINAFETALMAANHDMQLSLINAHPDLAGKAKLTADSQSEQSGAGLDTLTNKEMAKFNDLNARYKAKFNFPFIFAVKGATKHQILASFEMRIENAEAVEFETALENIKRIFGFRIEDQVI